MTKTIADMTPDERISCVGMWCKVGSKIHPAVLIYTNKRRGFFISPAGIEQYSEDLTRVSPRFDLPRAWQPDGTPAREVGA